MTAFRSRILVRDKSVCVTEGEQMPDETGGAFWSQRQFERPIWLRQNQAVRSIRREFGMALDNGQDVADVAVRYAAGAILPGRVHGDWRNCVRMCKLLGDVFDCNGSCHPCIPPCIEEMCCIAERTVRCPSGNSMTWRRSVWQAQRSPKTFFSNDICPGSELPPMSGDTPI